MTTMAANLSALAFFYQMMAFVGFTFWGYLQGRSDAGENPSVLRPWWMGAWGFMWWVLSVAELAA